MDEQSLKATAKAMVAPGKGVFAVDVPIEGVIGFWGEGKVTEDGGAARDFQEMLFRTKGLGDSISSIIVPPDVLDQQSKDGTSFPELISQLGIMFGVNPAIGWQHLDGTPFEGWAISKSPDELIPTGMDGLQERLQKWRGMGASFVKWRVIARMEPGFPTARGIEAGANQVAQYAALAQEAGLVPIVEPDVDMIGEHDIKRHFEVSEWFLHRTFEALYEHGVMLEGIVLKTNMVLSGSKCPTQADVGTVAAESIKCMRRAVPAAVPGIAFLSGGQTDMDSTIHLNALNMLEPQPWRLSFSYGRAIGRPPMKAWDGKIGGSAGQTALLHRAKMNSLATSGKWTAELEEAA